MLVLTRREGESLTITVGSEVFHIHFGDISKGRAKVAIEARPAVKVMRSEIVYGSNHPQKLGTSNGR